MISTTDDFNDKNINILSIDFETRHVAKHNRIRNQIFAAGCEYMPPMTCYTFSS
jgi:hypothetical protein